MIELRESEGGGLISLNLSEQTLRKRWPASRLSVGAGLFFMFEQLYKQNGLIRSWQEVRRNAAASSHTPTRHEAMEFDKNILSRVASISAKIRQGTYAFSPATGVLKAKKGKAGFRGIVSYKLEDRLVQRRILDLLQEDIGVQHLTNSAHSFGGIKGKSVRDAIKKAHEIITDGGAQYYIRSDIKKFFDHIPRETVLGILSKVIDDEKFIRVLGQALTLELNNRSSLGANDVLFPLREIGVPQGNSLSAFAGNVLLHEFDEKLNTDTFSCLRYVDDFVILAKSEKYARKCLEHAIEILKGFGLTAYDPKYELEKAEAGWTNQGFDLLGCKVHQTIINPSLKNRRAILGKIRAIISESKAVISDSAESISAKHSSMPETLLLLSDTLQGWVNQYGFCNAKDVFEHIQREVDLQVSEYFRFVRKHVDICTQLGAEGVVRKRRILGIFTMQDRKSAPIID